MSMNRECVKYFQKNVFQQINFDAMYILISSLYIYKKNERSNLKKKTKKQIIK